MENPRPSFFHCTTDAMPLQGSAHETFSAKGGAKSSWPRNPRGPPTSHGRLGHGSARRSLLGRKMETSILFRLLRYSPDSAAQTLTRQRKICKQTSMNRKEPAQYGMYN